MKSEDITGDLDLLGDWLDAKGYTEEAGLCTRAMDEINRLQQVSALTCDKCGWAMQFPGEECRNCGYEALRAENARLREALKPFAAKAEIYSEWAGTARDAVWFPISDLRAARAAMGETE